MFHLFHLCFDLRMIYTLWDHIPFISLYFPAFLSLFMIFRGMLSVHAFSYLTDLHLTEVNNKWCNMLPSSAECFFNTRRGILGNCYYCYDWSHWLMDTGVQAVWWMHHTLTGNYVICCCRWRLADGESLEVVWCHRLHVKGGGAYF